MLSNRVSREGREKVVTRRRTWKVDIYQIVFLKDSLADRDDGISQHLPSRKETQPTQGC